MSAVHNRFSGLIVILFCGAAWIGIRHLDYAEFATAGRMFLGGKFRRIIDAETRLLNFESSLAKAADVDECWNRIRQGSGEFGFQGARMSIQGSLFEDVGGNHSHPLWQLRIPLADGEYVNFFSDFSVDMDPLILNQFVAAVERGLNAWLAAQQPEPIRMPATQLYYTAAAVTTAPERRAV